MRMANAKGKSSFKFKSRSGSSASNPKNRKWAARKMAQESLPVAGLGADSTRESGLVCVLHLACSALPRCSIDSKRLWRVNEATANAGVLQVWAARPLGS